VRRERTLSQGPSRIPTEELRRAPQMADVAYLALTLGVFVLLALMLRGLEKI
jgi:predicted lysophospholipase L1 biosynthesis ABC-type transport system permease subunit